jgi:heme-degrading monooxygenase HmoA
MPRDQRRTWHYLVIWEFRVRPGMESRFERAYGADGPWARLFLRSQDYIGTELNHDSKDRGRYVTLDYWTSQEAYEAFRKQYHAEYRAIDQECEALTESEAELGSLERVAPISEAAGN